MELCRKMTQTPAFLPIRFEDHNEGGLKKARKPPVKETRQVAGVEQWDMCIAMKNRMLWIRNRFYCNFFQLSHFGGTSMQIPTEHVLGEARDPTVPLEVEGDETVGWLVRPWPGTPPEYTYLAGP
ncbi:hypothetical protein B0H13DRAFT_1851102 [Mycena leptocephala]|nr:hypothetical protein B0H13DRAFT_1851102 [Mycena leptocephala]